ncbi:hypothetical protein OO006_10245 [Prosthecochloris sp. SCSIO W1101]|uniref:hypothetical protein n=1 Tax=Prosthecochloris sp. SCSIO W1101 TaxID=2992242 RepID=UPI00223CF800|nr:hypothetical protein [Prosthecochloris sp. SCSIO W1101]UZJ40729.1 hypothetical protein OO006_10245 [Prosthecochloris sp. SCSIO W1101]
MSTGSFLRVQIAGLFILSVAGMLVHMSLHNVFSSNMLFGWGEGLIGAMQLEGATLASIAEAAKLPAHEGMSGAMYYVAVVWLALLMVPAILPLLSDQKVWRWVTVIVGVVMAMGGLLDSAFHLTVPEEIPFGLAGIVLSTLPGITGVVFAVKWVKK